MSSQSANSEVDGQQSEAVTVNLQIISPSVGVNRPLFFRDLDASTTVKELKGKIRDMLPMRPANENQRLIHRGRAIVRETDSLLDIFGKQMLQSTDQQTIHLVIKNTDPSQTIHPAPAPQQIPSTHRPTPTVPLPHSSQGPQPVNTRPPSGLPTPPGLGFQGGSPWGPPQNMQAAQDNGQPAGPSPHQNMTEWLRSIAERTHQQTRALHEARGRMPYFHDANGQLPQSAELPNSTRASSAPGHTIYRETIGPNGRMLQMQTVIRSGPARRNEDQYQTPGDTRATPPSHGLSPEAQAQLNELHRSASNVSLQSRTLGYPSVTTPLLSAGGFSFGTQRHPMEQGSRSASGGNNLPVSASAPQQAMEVYIISSPEGPRALLINNNTSERYYTPSLRAPASYPQLRPSNSAMNIISENPVSSLHGAGSSTQQAGQTGTPMAVPARPQAPTQQQVAQQAQAQGDGQAQQPVAVPVGGGLGHPNNPAVAALPPALVRVWPHIWMTFRVALFLWLFTTSDSGWVRWATIIVVTLLALLLSTGAMNNFVDNAWRPLGRHLENMLPTLDHPRFRREPTAAGANSANTGLQQDVTARQIAARLVDQRQQQDSWLPRQLRRMERAGLLFLASIAPGVAERHIANMEIQARAETQRREAEEAAAVAQREVDTNNERAAAQQTEAAEHASATSEHREDSQPEMGSPAGEQQITA